MDKSLYNLYSLHSLQSLLKVNDFKTTDGLKVFDHNI